MNNQGCKSRPEMINVNSNNPVFYRFSKWSGNCNNINDPYAKIYVPDVIKDLNVKVFNLMSRTNETTHMKWDGTCKCVCWLDAKVCNNKQRWYDKGYAWNPSDCECECDKSFDVGEYLDHENCKCRKKLVDKLVDECTETVEEVKITKITLAENENSYNYSTCTVYIVLFWMFFAINVGGIGTYFVYFHWYLKKDVTPVGVILALKQIFNKHINGKH